MCEISNENSKSQIPDNPVKPSEIRKLEDIIANMRKNAVDTTIALQKERNKDKGGLVGWTVIDKPYY